MVAGRAFAFADPEIVSQLQAVFVPVCTDDWYTRRRKDAEGEFFRKVAEQGPRKGAGGATRQGIYAFTADGELLAFKNAGQDVQATREQLKQALRKWAALPKGRREPGAVTVPPHGPLDKDYTRTVPEGGLVVRVHARILDRKGDTFEKGECEFAGGDKASRDFLWVTAAEAKAMAPAKAEVGFTYPLPEPVAKRIARFHLIDNTRGEPAFWGKEQVKERAVTLIVTAVTPDAVELRLDGSVKLEGEGRGFDAKLRGVLRYRPGTGTFDRWEAAAVGESWGDHTVTKSKGTRPGRTPLGLTFDLADPAVPANRVSPQGIREIGAYLGRYE